MFIWLNCKKLSLKVSLVNKNFMWGASTYDFHYRSKCTPLSTCQTTAINLPKVLLMRDIHISRYTVKFIFIIIHKARRIVQSETIKHTNNNSKKTKQKKKLKFKHVIVTPKYHTLLESETKLYYKIWARDPVDLNNKVKILK